MFSVAVSLHLHCANDRCGYVAFLAADHIKRFGRTRTPLIHMHLNNGVVVETPFFSLSLSASVCALSVNCIFDVPF